MDQQAIRYLETVGRAERRKGQKKLLNYLKENKLCPSKIGLVDYFGIECESDEYYVSCDLCREESVNKLESCVEELLSHGKRPKNQ